MIIVVIEIMIMMMRTIMMMIVGRIDVHQQIPLFLLIL